VDSEPRARDILDTLPMRDAVGHALVERVGGRAWTAPSFAKGRAIFRRCGLPDPWDPDAPAVEIGLGDIGVDIAGRKPVAPHAAPPAGASPAAASFARGVPAGRAAPSESRPAPQLGSSRELTEKERERLRGPEAKRVQGPAPRRATHTFGPPQQQHAVAKLPVRPGVALPAAAGGDAGPGPAATPPPSPASGRGGEGAGRAPRDPGPHPAATPPPSPASARGGEGAGGSGETAAAPPPPPRKPPASTGGLDDLFGLGGGEPRLRMPARDASTAARKKVVTSDEELSRGSVDRRPPPAKPPGKE
jgi:hypothetical protein